MHMPNKGDQFQIAKKGEITNDIAPLGIVCNDLALASVIHCIFCNFVLFLKTDFRMFH